MLETLGMGDVWGSPEVPDDTASLWLSMPIAPEFEKRLEKWLSERTKLELDRCTWQNKASLLRAYHEYEDMVADDAHMKMRGNFIEWETEDGDTFKGLSPNAALRADARPSMASDACSKAATPSMCSPSSATHLSRSTS